MFRKRLVATVIAVTFSVSASASVLSEMQNWFNEMGAYSNATGMQVLKGQTTTVYTGGSLYMRTPVKNYQLFSIEPPHINAGCGGIDLFAGSFSFMNSEQMTALLHNVANNAIVLAFMQAVKTISPQLADILQYIQDQIAKINGMNMNSCQLAEGVVTATLGPILSDKKEQSTAQGTGASLSNLWSDSLQSYDEWRKDKNAKKQARQQVANADANAKEMLQPGNIVWKALRKTGVPDDLKELMMSLIGTIIIEPVGEGSNQSGNTTKWRYVGPTGIKFTDFIGSPGSSTVNNVTLLKCSDYDCTNPVATPNQSVASLSWNVRKTMEKATSNITQRKPQSFTGLDYALYMTSPIPLWRVANVSASINQSSSMTDSYAEAVAVDVAYSWFNEMVQAVQKALANNSTAQSQDIIQVSAELEKRIAEVRTIAASELGAKYQQAVTAIQMQMSSQWLHEMMVRALSPDVLKSMMAFNR